MLVIFELLNYDIGYTYVDYRRLSTVWMKIGEKFVYGCL